MESERKIDTFTPVRSLRVGDRIGRNKIVYIDDRSIVAESANGRFTVVDVNGESLSDTIVLKHGIKRLSEAIDYAKNLGGRKIIMEEKKSQGTSMYKGVTKAGYGWQAQMSIDGINTYLGHFLTEIEAARAYNKKAMEIYNDKAYTNPLPGDPDFGIRKPFDSRFGTGGKAGRFVDPSKLKGKTSKYKGVYWNETFGKWVVDIDRKDLKYRKSFDEEIDAAKDYNRVMREKYGDNAIFNDIPEEENKMDNEYKYKGVSTVTGSNKFRAQIWDPFKKEIVHLGSSYDTREEAAKVYNDYAMILFDDKAYTNPIPGEKDFGKREALSARDYAKSIRQEGAGVESESSGEIEENVEKKKRVKKYSPLRGVSYSRACGMWTASFDREGIYWIDYYKTEKEASDARDKKLIETFGMNKVKHLLNNVSQYYISAHDPFPGRKTKERKIIQSPSSVISKISKREVTSKEPIRHSKYPYGVTYIGDGLWQSHIIVPGEGWQQLGVHTNDRSAAEAYNEAAKPHGLPLNEIEEEITDIEMESIKKIVEEPEYSEPKIEIGEAMSGGLDDLRKYDRNIDGTIGDFYKHVDGTVKKKNDDEGDAGVVSR